MPPRILRLRSSLVTQNTTIWWIRPEASWGRLVRWMFFLASGSQMLRNVIRVCSQENLRRSLLILFGKFLVRHYNVVNSIKDPEDSGDDAQRH